jgi:flagellar biosynthetic protein FliQ
MSLDLVINLLSQAFYIVLLILAPVLGASLIIGIVISIFQAATSLQEITLTFVPKIVITAVAIIITLPFMAHQMINITIKIFNMIATVIK